MNRREFLVAGTGAFLAPDCDGANFTESAGAGSPAAGPDVFIRLVRANDEAVFGLMQKQDRRIGHPAIGGLADGTGIYTAGAGAGFIKMLAAAFCSDGSRYQGSSELVSRLEMAARFMLNIQNSDGTIDLHTTNFHSPPDTAFVVEPMAAALQVLRKKGLPVLERLQTDLDRFLKSAGEALVTGGIHTPNHRWVVCAALARLFSLYPSSRYTERIDEWLSEGIDIDPDGQFAERSTSIYSPVTDNSLLTIARLLDRPALLEPVRRNLAMNLYYLHSDGEIATEGSLRQDQYARGSTWSYHIPYRFLAIKDQDAHFAAMARLIENNAGGRLAGNLIYLLEEPDLMAELPHSRPLPDNFARIFTHSGLARIRRGPVSATILSGNPTFFSFHKGTLALEAVRLAAAFFGKGQFQGKSLEIESGRYTLRQELTAPYYQPLPAGARRGDGDWRKMDRALRPQSEVQNLNCRVSISESKGQFEIEFDLSGCDRVPVAVELGFRKGGELSGVKPLQGKADAYLHEQETGRYTIDNKTIEFGPGFARHSYTEVRGALPKLNALSVYLTGFTPFQWRLRIT